MRFTSNITPSREIENLIARTKLELMKKHTFFAIILMKAQTIYTDKVQTCATDGKHLLINPEFVDTLTDKEFTAVTLHEALHIVFKHHLRGKGLKHDLFNIACDVIINEYVRSEDHTLPDDCWDWDRCIRECNENGKTDVVSWLQSRTYKDVSADELYHRLNDQDDQEDDQDSDQSEGQGDGDGEQSSPSGDDGSQTPQSEVITDPTGQGAVIQATDDFGNELDDQAIADAETELTQTIFNAGEMARNRGNQPAWLEGHLDKLRQPVITWQDEINQSVKETGNRHASDWNRRDKKSSRRGVFLPRRCKQGAGTIVVACDTSASVRQPEYEALMAEITGIAEDVDPEEVIVIYCDTKIAKVDRFDDAQDIEASDLGRFGGGGTDFEPPFKWVEDNDIDPQCFVYLTDLECNFPDEPDYPTVWVSVRKGREAPFGKTIEIDA
jgi:predicted metal-dependent peptidase